MPTSIDQMSIEELRAQATRMHLTTDQIGMRVSRATKQQLRDAIRANRPAAKPAQPSAPKAAKPAAAKTPKTESVEVPKGSVRFGIPGKVARAMLGTEPNISDDVQAAVNECIASKQAEADVERALSTKVGHGRGERYVAVLTTAQAHRFSDIVYCVQNSVTAVKGKGFHGSNLATYCGNTVNAINDAFDQYGEV